MFVVRMRLLLDDKDFNWTVHYHFSSLTLCRLVSTVYTGKYCDGPRISMRFIKQSYKTVRDRRLPTRFVTWEVRTSMIYFTSSLIIARHKVLSRVLLSVFSRFCAFKTQTRVGWNFIFMETFIDPWNAGERKSSD